MAQGDRPSAGPEGGDPLRRRSRPHLRFRRIHRLPAAEGRVPRPDRAGWTSPRDHLDVSRSDQRQGARRAGPARRRRPGQLSGPGDEAARQGLAVPSSGRARHRMRWLLEPVGRRPLLRPRVERSPAPERTRRRSSVGFTRPSRATGTRRSTSPYSLADRQRLDAALLEAKGYAHAPSVGRRSAPSTSSIEAAVGRIRRDPAGPKPHQRLVLDTLEHRRDVVRRAPTPGRRRHGHRQDGHRRPRLCPALRARAPRPRLLFVAHREQILEQARATFRKR